MARKKKVTKPKEPVKLRFRTLANGNRSILLDCYINGERTYEFLKLYLVPEDGSQERATQNANTMQAALAIKAQRIREVINGKAGISATNEKSKALLLDYLELIRIQKVEAGQSKSRSITYKSLIAHLKKYKGEKVRIKDVDESFCRGFIKYLSKAKTIGRTKGNSTIAQGAAYTYFIAFKSAINQAVKQGYLDRNPISKLDKDDLKSVSRVDSSRTYLSIEELKKLMATECKDEQVKKAFLFSCFSGLRISDVKDLKWKNIIVVDGESRVSKRIIKTGRDLEIPLSGVALKYLPERGDKSDNEYVYSLPVTHHWINQIIRDWGKNAEVKKDLCYHMSRHTFATMELTLDVDLYTVSKMLGHQNVATTQIYADIVNKKKTAAVSKQDTLFTSDN